MAIKYSSLRETIKDDIATIVNGLNNVPLAQIVDTNAALQAVTPSANLVKMTRGRTAVNDGGQGQWIWIDGDTTAADGISVLASTVAGYVPGGANEGRWKRLGAAASSGISASRPTSIPIGHQFFDTTLGYTIWWNGAAWVDSAGTPV